MRPYGQKRVGYGDDTKQGRAEAKKAFLEAMKDCKCKHQIAIADQCAECDAEFDADEAASKGTGPNLE